jgi:hypothetical protein
MEQLKVELLSRMGVALLEIQQTERALKMCIGHFLPKNPEMTAAMVSAQVKAERRKTLGYFLAELRKRITVQPYFDELLTRFLDNRNGFAHDFLRVPNVSLQTEQGVRVGIDFVKNLIEDAIGVRRCVDGLVQMIGKRMDLDLTTKPDEDELNQLLARLVFKPTRPGA